MCCFQFRNGLRGLMGPDDATVTAISQGEFDETCTVRDFLTYMPPAAGFRQVSRPHEDDNHQLHVFCPPPPSSSIQCKFKSFLLSLENWQWMHTGGCLIQFWALIPSRSKWKRLSVSEQPFGVGKLCNGVCRYRHRCIQYANGMEDISEADPIYRSFTRGSSEFSPNIDSYSIEEFPLKDYAQSCGFQGYLALPVFEHRNDRQCQLKVSAGVLEILTFTANISLDVTFLEKIKGAGLAIRCPPPNRKPELCIGEAEMRVVVLYPLRGLYNLPLIQVWFPCICKGAEVSFSCDRDSTSPKITHLFRCLEQKSLPFPKCFDGNAYFVEDGKSWVGRAHSLSKISFVEDIRQFSISDYPLVPLARLSNLTTCCAIPFSSIHPDLPPLVLEAFLPKHSDVERRRDFLKSLLCTLVQQLPKYDVDFGLTEGEEFSVDFSHRDDAYNVVYYDVRRSGARTGCQALGDVKEDCEEATVLEDNVQDYQSKNGQLGEASKATKIFYGDQVQSHESLGSHGEEQWEPSSIQKPGLETTDDRNNSQGATETSRKIDSKTRKRGINLTVLQKYFGQNLEDVAAELKVHKSTLKRYCRSYGIKRWPSHKRNKANPVLRPPDEVGDCGGGKEQECDSRPSPNHKSREKEVTDANGAGIYNFDLNHALIVKAKYKEYTVKFPFSMTSGIDALLRSLGMRFKMEADRIRIEYEDEDGDGIMISCDEDLSYHMHTLSTSGRTRMDLSVLPAG